MTFKKINNMSTEVLERGRKKVNERAGQ